VHSVRQAIRPRRVRLPDLAAESRIEGYRIDVTSAGAAYSHVHSDSSNCVGWGSSKRASAPRSLTSRAASGHPVRCDVLPSMMRPDSTTLSSTSSSSPACAAHALKLPRAKGSGDHGTRQVQGYATRHLQVQPRRRPHRETSPADFGAGIFSEFAQPTQARVEERTDGARRPPQQATHATIEHVVLKPRMCGGRDQSLVIRHATGAKGSTVRSGGHWSDRDRSNAYRLPGRTICRNAIRYFHREGGTFRGAGPRAPSRRGQRVGPLQSKSARAPIGRARVEFIWRDSGATHELRLREEAARAEEAEEEGREGRTPQP